MQAQVLCPASTFSTTGATGTGTDAGWQATGGVGEALHCLSATCSGLDWSFATALPPLVIPQLVHHSRTQGPICQRLGAQKCIGQMPTQTLWQAPHLMVVVWWRATNLVGRGAVTSAHRWQRHSWQCSRLQPLPAGRPATWCSGVHLYLPTSTPTCPPQDRQPDAGTPLACPLCSDCKGMPCASPPLCIRTLAPHVSPRSLLPSCATPPPHAPPLGLPTPPQSIPARRFRSLQKMHLI